jgi:hypothetical protein
MNVITNFMFTSPEFSDEEIQKVRVFRNTYNAYYLEGLSQRQLNFVKDFNPVFSRLIDNLQSLRKRYAQYTCIEGPYTLHKFKMQADGSPKKSFYIFGERHNDSRGHCIGSGGPSIEFYKYLQLLAYESPSFIDVYVELEMVKSKYDEICSTIGIIPFSLKLMLYDESLSFQDSIKESIESRNGEPVTYSSYMLNRIQQSFSTCLQPALRNVPQCRLIRIHNIDIRETWDNIKVDYGLNLLRQIINAATSTDEVIDLIRRISLETTMILVNLRILATGNLMGLLMLSKKVKDEVELSYEEENITNFIQNKLNTDFETRILSILANSLISSVTNGSPFNHTLDDLKDIEENIQDIEVLKMDMYALARIFKPYNIYRDNPRGAFQPIESKNIIIYAGNFHCKTYVEFLQYLATVGQDVALTYQYVNPSTDVSRRNFVKINKSREYIEGTFPYCGIQ